jgi:tRNA threonylcarbamoyladenosine biosynthesis protein TsaE
MILPGEEDTLAAGRKLAGVLRAGDVVTLEGDLGAGKSTFARGVLRGLGYAGDVPSPTFALVIPYDPPAVSLPVWHVDLYRLEDPREADALALEEGLDGGALLIEWPQRLGHQWHDRALRLTLTAEPNGGRRLTVSVPRSWEGRCPFQ